MTSVSYFMEIVGSGLSCSTSMEQNQVIKETKPEKNSLMHFCSASIVRVEVLFLHLVSPYDVSLCISRNNSVTESKRTVMSGMGPGRLTFVLYLHVGEEKGKKFVYSLVWVSWSNGFV